MTFSRSIIITMAAAAVFALAAAMPAFAQGGATREDLDCYTDRQIQAAIESGQILSLAKIKRLAGISAYDDVSDPAQVCMIDGVPHYILKVISPDGEAAKIALNAVDGTEEVL